MTTFLPSIQPAVLTQPLPNSSRSRANSAEEPMDTIPMRLGWVDCCGSISANTAWRSQWTRTSPNKEQNGAACSERPNLRMCKVFFRYDWSEVAHVIHRKAVRMNQICSSVAEQPASESNTVSSCLACGFNLCIAAMFAAGLTYPEGHCAQFCAYQQTRLATSICVEDTRNSLCVSRLSHSVARYRKCCKSFIMRFTMATNQKVGSSTLSGRTT